jgi:hypothetical protein
MVAAADERPADTHDHTPLRLSAPTSPTTAARQNPTLAPTRPLAAPKARQLLRAPAPGARIRPKSRILAPPRTASHPARQLAGLVLGGLIPWDPPGLSAGGLPWSPPDPPAAAPGSHQPAASMSARPLTKQGASARRGQLAWPGSSQGRVSPRRRLGAVAKIGRAGSPTRNSGASMAAASDCNTGREASTRRQTPTPARRRHAIAWLRPPGTGRVDLTRQSEPRRRCLPTGGQPTNPAPAQPPASRPPPRGPPPLPLQAARVLRPCRLNPAPCYAAAPGLHARAATEAGSVFEAWPELARCNARRPSPRFEDARTDARQPAAPHFRASLFSI